MYLKKTIILGVVFFALSLNLFSQAGDDTIKVRAKRDALDPSTTSLATTIITSDEIEAMGADNVAEALKNYTGMQVLFQGNSAVLSIRGSRAEQTVVLVNGQRQNSAQGLGVDLSQYSIVNIERIEIVRGAASTRYGPNAVGGVINIITKDRVESFDSSDVTLKFGSYGSMIIGGNVNKYFGDNNRANLFISGNMDYSKGDYEYSGKDGSGNEVSGKVPNNERMQGDIRTGFGYKLNNNDYINMSVSAFNQYSGQPGSYQFGAFSETANQYIQRYSGDIHYENNSLDIFSFNIRASTVYQIKDYQNPNPNPEWSVHDVYDNVSTDLSFDIEREDIFAGGLFTFNNSVLVEYRNNYFKTKNEREDEFENGESIQRNTFSIAYLPTLGFLNHYDSDTPMFKIIPGIRFDAVLSSGANDDKNFYEPTYSIGLMYIIDPLSKYIIKGNFNTGYRLPGFDDLYDLNGGNVDLKKEKSIGGDIGFVLNPIKILKIEALYYITSLEDMITWTPSPAPTDPYKWKAYNIDDALLQGIEADISLSVPIIPILSSIAISLNYLYQFGVGTQNAITQTLEDKKLARTPEHSVSSMISYIYEGNDIFSGRLNFLVNYVGERYNDLENKVKLDEYVTLDITASMTFIDSVILETGVKNILNEQYEVVRYYSTPGREWYIALSGRI